MTNVLNDGLFRSALAGVVRFRFVLETRIFSGDVGSGCTGTRLGPVSAFLGRLALRRRGAPP